MVALSYTRWFQLARKITKEDTTGSVQTKYWTNWKNGKEDVKAGEVLTIL